jgi:selT/selW/selH-like putative selenoprotein
VEAELSANFPDSKIELIRGSGGIFEVKCDDKLIFSKKSARSQRFPDKGEITQLIKKEME